MKQHVFDFFLFLFLFHSLCLAAVSSNKENQVQINKALIDSLQAKEIFFSEDGVPLEEFFRRIASETSPERWVSLSIDVVPPGGGFSLYGDFFNVEVPYYLHLTPTVGGDAVVAGPFTATGSNTLPIAGAGINISLEPVSYQVALYRENSVEIPFRGASFGHSPVLTLEGAASVCSAVSAPGVFEGHEGTRYCLPDPINAGVGWTLLYQTRDQSGESEPLSLNSLLNSNIGSPSSLSDSSSYFLARDQWKIVEDVYFNEFLYLVFTDGTEKPYDEPLAFVFRTPSADTLPFPDNIGPVSPISLKKACSLDLTTCYVDAYLRYCGEGFFTSVLCDGEWSNSFGGMWGICSQAHSSLHINHIFGGVSGTTVSTKIQQSQNSPPPTRLFGRHTPSPSF